MKNYSLLEKAAKSVTTKSDSRPSSDSVVEALLEAEKTARKSKKSSSLAQLLGSWRLCFITGTKKTRQRAGIMLESGRYIPRFVNIKLSYYPEDTAISSQQFEAGRVENSVELGALKLTLSGPTKFLPQKNILAFDFTKIKVELFGFQLYCGTIRGGEESEEKFYETSVGKQAFFAYFLLEEGIIAARGRGGGLALWGRLEGYSLNQ